MNALDEQQPLSAIAERDQLLNLLYDALRDLEQEISSRFGNDAHMSDKLRLVILAARAAIAKAELPR